MNGLRLPRGWATEDEHRKTKKDKRNKEKFDAQNDLENLVAEQQLSRVEILAEIFQR